MLRLVSTSNHIAKLVQQEVSSLQFERLDKEDDK